MKYLVSISYVASYSDAKDLHLKLTEEQMRLMKLLRDEGYFDDYSVDIAPEDDSWKEV